MQRTPGWWVLALCSVVVCVAFAAGCLQSESVRCGELWCPQGTVCAPDHVSCVSVSRLVACVDKLDGQACTLSRSQAARCLQGVCTAIVCGDGHVDGDEVCDDGNTTACDGCSADCHSDETCGNAILDCEEQCDRGGENADTPNALCRRSCQRPGCGDGVVDDQSGEDCDGTANEAETCADYGFYSGKISCSSTCRNDTGSCRETCGDAIINGSEVCDELPPVGENCLDFGYDVGNLHCSAYCTPDFDRCDRLGFQPMSLPSSSILRSLWSPGERELIAVGDDGTILHFHDAEWHALDSAGDLQLMAVWGSARDHAFVVGRRGGSVVRGTGAVILRYDGERFSAVPVTDAGAALNAVWGSSFRDIWAAGAGGVLLHFDGEQWSRRESPTTRDLYGVWVASSGEAFAVGDADSVLRYDGSAWQTMPVPVREPLYGVWGAAPDDVYAVGQLGVVIHYDGRSWTKLEPGFDANYFTGVWGRASNDVFVYGSRGTILHYDGRTWAVVPVSVDQEIQALLSDGVDDVYGVGAYTAVRLTPGGPVFRTVPAPTFEDLTAIWASSPSDITVVGLIGEVLHFDGTRWTEVIPGEPHLKSLFALWGSASDDIYAAGAGGTLEHYDGTRWSPVALPTTATLWSVWGSGADDVYVVGDQGSVLHGNAAGFELVDTGATGALTSVWGFARDDVYIGGPKGQLVHYDGERWQPLALPTAADVLGLWGGQPTRLFVMTADGVLLGAATTGFDATEQPPDAPIARAGGASLRNTFGFASGSVELLHYDGIDWAPVRLDNFVLGMNALWMWPDAGGYIVGKEGMILEISRFCGKHESQCGDRWDNDCDGLLNCHDPDCAEDALCQAGGACRSTGSLDCNSTYSGSTVFGERHHSTYPCSLHAERGREVFHRLVVPTTGRVSVTLPESAQALDLIAVGPAAAGGCDPIDACLAESMGGQPLQFTATAGVVYYVVVEAQADGTGTYTLEVSCP